VVPDVIGRRPEETYVGSTEDRMCLGVPGQILQIVGKEALVDFWGQQQIVRLDALHETVELGDYIIDHAGFAVRKIAVEEVANTLSLYEIVLNDTVCDPIVADTIAELQALR
jgi:hydrogenase expression/formation protein HypC